MTYETKKRIGGTRELVDVDAFATALEVSAEAASPLLTNRHRKWSEHFASFVALHHFGRFRRIADIVRDWRGMARSLTVESKRGAVAWAIRQRSVSSLRSSVGSRTGAPV